MKNALCVLLLVCLFSAPVFARGDRVIPQIADGPGIRTKLDITCLADYADGAITKMKLQFFRQDGSKWSLQTSVGTGSEFDLSIGQRITYRIETQGASASQSAGYAVIKDLETGVSEWATDYRIGISVFYEIKSGSSVADTVAVPVGQPTVSWVFPTEISTSQNLYTGFAIVNLAGSDNKVQFDLWGLGVSDNPDSTAIFTLRAGQQRAEFLTQTLFPTKTNFKGTITATSEKPVAVLTLLQTAALGGVQYATIAPEYRDGLRNNCNLYLSQVALTEFPPLYMPLDADDLRADYFRNGSEDGYSWDVVYETQSKTARRLVAQNGAEISAIGKREPKDFDNLSLSDLVARTYVANGIIDLSDGAATPARDAGTYAFAIKTNLGRYAKVRIAKVITISSGTDTYYDLVVEVYTFR